MSAALCRDGIAYPWVFICNPLWKSLINNYLRAFSLKFEFWIKQYIPKYIIAYHYPSRLRLWFHNWIHSIVGVMNCSWCFTGEEGFCLYFWKKGRLSLLYNLVLSLICHPSSRRSSCGTVYTRPSWIGIIRCTLLFLCLSVILPGFVFYGGPSSYWWAWLHRKQFCWLP